MGLSYKIVSIERAEAPVGMEGAKGYSYKIAFGDDENIQGFRQGSLKDVTSAVNEIVDQLNERHSKKRKKEKKTK